MDCELRGRRRASCGSETASSRAARRHRRWPLLPFSAVAAVALILPASAATARKTTLERSSGNVAATVSFRGSVLFATNVRLRIERGGEALVSGRVLDRESGGPTASAPTGLSVRDLDGDGEPEVVLDLHTGGAHCCTVSRIHRLEPDGASYAASEYDWGNYGYELRDIEGDGVPEFVGVDDRFAYVFAPFAATSSPVRVWRLVRGGLSDVTSDQPELIRADARRWWRAYRSERRRPLARRADLRGILAAWQADKVQLGEAAHGWKVLRAARRRGELRGPEPWPSGRRYLTHVRTFLARKGYVR